MEVHGTFTRTRRPASRHARAATFSRTQPRRPRTTAFPHAARWWPRTLRGRPHRQERAAEEQNAKRLRCQTELLFVRDGCECCRSHGACLGTHESGFCVSQLRTHGVPEVTSLNRLNGQLLPPLSRVAKFCMLPRGLWLLQQKILPQRLKPSREGCAQSRAAWMLGAGWWSSKPLTIPQRTSGWRSKTILRLSAQLAQ